MNERARSLGIDATCVVMPPGSRWSEEAGFELRPFDYSNRSACIQDLLKKYAPKLDACYEREGRALANFGSFERYLRGAFEAMPRWLPFIRSFRVVFLVRDASGEHHWLADFGRAEVRVVDAREPASLVLEIPASILNDCTERRMFATLGPSKRLRFRLGEGATWFDVRLVLSLLELYELELLPLRRQVSRRHLGIWLRRWPEGVELARIVIRHKVLRKPFRVANLYPVRGA